MLMRGENRKGSVHLSWDYAYAGPISKILRQIDEWMGAHPYEVVGINFNSNFQAEYREVIYTSLLQLLEDKWGPTVARQNSKDLAMSTFFQETGDWPTLLQAIETNQRVFIFISHALSNKPSLLPWVHAPPASTWTAVTTSHTICSVVVDIANISLCTNRPVLLQIGVYNFGICISAKGVMHCCTKPQGFVTTSVSNLISLSTWC